MAWSDCCYLIEVDIYWCKQIFSVGSRYLALEADFLLTGRSVLVFG